MSTDWFWEGNVVIAVAENLRKRGWTIEGTANTETREAGVDLHATKNGKVLLVEIKGYPSKFYMRGEKKGLPKPTNPRTQARHWYSEVLLSAILRKTVQPAAIVAIAFPEFDVFESFVRRTEEALRKLGISVLFVDESGGMRIIGRISI
jgi:hypothetical protein